MQRKFLVYLLLLLLPVSSFATHIKAGDIVIERVSATDFLTYRFKLSLYTNTVSTVEQSEATLSFGDGTSATNPRLSKTDVGNSTALNTFEFIHTYNGVGFYRAGFTEFNRNANILNMANSVNTPFYIEAALSIDPFLGINNSPVLSVPPVDFGAIDQIFKHNPGAYDTDGDSLSYKLITPRQAVGVDVIGYRDPADPYFEGSQVGGGPANLTLNAVTGDLVWNTPSDFIAGDPPRFYNIAILIEEWRFGVRIGYVVRDMQIEILPSTNRPPILSIPKDTCIAAGSSLFAQITASDPDNFNVIALEAFGEPLAITPGATFSVVDNTTSSPVGNFNWNNIGCDRIREQAYQLIFKASDNPGGLEPLTDVQSWLIYVKGPKPSLPIVAVNGAQFDISWSNYQCSQQVSNWLVYRKVCGSAPFTDPCNTGIDLASGYSLIATLPASASSFSDANVNRGITYCYRLVAKFSGIGKGESLPSDESCGILDLDVPIPAFVQVTNTDPIVGETRVHWYRPIGIPGPFTFRLERAPRNTPTTFTQIYQGTDTFFVETNLNTSEDWVYRVTHIETSVSSVLFGPPFIDLTPGQNSIQVNITNPGTLGLDSMHLYRSVNGGGFVLYQRFYAPTETFRYLDLNLPACDTFCYYVATFGAYCDARLPGVKEYRSAERCGNALNGDIPRTPNLLLEGCQDNILDTNNLLKWSNVKDPFCDNLSGYELWFSPHREDEFSIIYTGIDTSFIYENLQTLAGCYFVRAVNLNGIPSGNSDTSCVDDCVFYKLPNLVTRNGDERNDLFSAFPIPDGVKNVEVRIYNQWGALIYEDLETIDIDWYPGNLSEGIYFYEVRITYFGRLRKEDEIELRKAWVHILGAPYNAKD
jgi:hypothetical protein